MIDDILHENNISVQGSGAFMGLRDCYTLRYSKSNQNEKNALTHRKNL